jgi:hypothetical protein
MENALFDIYRSSTFNDDAAVIQEF